MPTNIYKKIVLKLLQQMKLGKLKLVIDNSEQYDFGSDGLVAEIKINDESFFKKIVLHGDIGFGEAYMENVWETPNLTNVISFMILNINSLPGMSGSGKSFNPINLLRLYDKAIQAIKPNSIAGSKKNISAHYDLNNEFFKLFLDQSMTYSSALFEDNTESLQAAQERKYESLCQSIKLSPDDHVLEIGCGWGGFAIYAVRNYGCKVTGITISVEQFKYASERVENERLNNQIEIQLIDYRKIKGKYDKIVSIEMIEAVGHRYFKSYFTAINKLLKPSGVLGLQAIIIADKRYQEYRKSADWIRKHIFPGGLLPSVGIINQTINSTGMLNLFSMKEMGLSYSRTLKQWHNNFLQNLDSIKALGFDDVFIKKWEYYLCSCEASFKQRNINVVQMVYAMPNNPKF